MQLRRRHLPAVELIFFAASFLLFIFLYLPAIHGKPIWDDLAYWIFDPEMKSSFLELWYASNWPLSIFAQKIIMNIFGDHYVAYHLINVSLHLVNSFLVYFLAKSLRWPRPHWIFLLFLFHPANVISVAWMIQIKTLLCFLFAILSFFSFKKGLEKNLWMPVALGLFLLSMLSKSSAVMLPALFFLYACRKAPLRKQLWCIPFFAISLWGAYTMIGSRGPQANVVEYQNKKASVTRDLHHARNIAQVLASAPSATPLALSTLTEKSPLNIQLLMQTTTYYFWQALLPLQNSPVKGRSPPRLRAFDVVTVIFLICLLYFLWGSPPVWTLVSGFILLLPFLGLVEAPYMSITWVSDQHLYLALPILLAFWMMLLNKIPRRIAIPACIFLLVFFIVKTGEAAHGYSNEESFYEESLKADPGNVTVAFNFASTLAYQDKTDQALIIANRIHEMAERHPEIKTEKHYYEIEALRMKLIEFQDYKKQKNR